MREVRDHYFRKAKKQGYVARSVYKLQEINQKHNIIQKGDKVVDLGCFPGSWMQYIGESIGDSGMVVGIDLQELHIPLKRNMHFVQGDINELDTALMSKFASRFDTVCSDMAPKTTGIKSMDAERSYRLCQGAHSIARRCLEKGGNVIFKIFQGAPLEGFLGELKKDFTIVKRYKPESSRSESVEVFVIGLGKKR